MKTEKKKKLTTIYVLLLLLVAMASIGVVTAIVAKNVERRTNRFSFSTVNITVDEPGWDESEEKTVYPGKVYHKDPLVRNHSEHPMYVFLEVKIPTADVSVVKEDGTTIETKTAYALFTPVKINEPDWKEIVLPEAMQKETGYEVHVYAYMQEVSPHGKTPSLFDEVQFKSEIMEGEGVPENGDALLMPVNAYAVQPEYVGSFTDEASKLAALKNAFLSTYRLSGSDQ